MTDPLHTAEIAPVRPRSAPAGFVEKTPLERYVPPQKPSLVGLSRAALAQALGTIGVPSAQRKMRVRQLWHWLYVRGAGHFEEMTSVSKALRALLDAHFTLARPEVAAEQTSVDGTRKWLLRLPGAHAGEQAHEIECVYIPEPDRGTLCLSCQVGCTLTCSLPTGPAPGAQPPPGEIVSQIAWRATGSLIGRLPKGTTIRNGTAEQGTRRVSSIVMMGMGEPL
jgi:23S rRNA (adenine2503-C2)-methyltransferase